MLSTCEAEPDLELVPPKGNLNHLKDGVRSKQIQEAIARALSDPQGRTEVYELVRHWGAESAA
ncbi:MAG TPA: hypothetical protein VJ441_02785 [Dehalococcoidia bacterium]|nr:hypothetical protein [Dehalococcoidia bacterium]